MSKLRKITVNILIWLAFMLMTVYILEVIAIYNDFQSLILDRWIKPE